MKIPQIEVSDFITGEKFEALCDVDCEKDKHWQRTIEERRGNRVLTVFSQTHELKNRMPFLRKCKGKTFIVVSHNSDGALEYHDSGREFDYQWQNEPNIARWFSQNVDIREPNVTPIPIGHENEHIFREKTSVLKLKPIADLMRAAVPKQNKMYLCVRRGTNPIVRNHAYEMFDNLPWTTCEEGENNRDLFQPYIKQMARHQFILCPEGNGTDTVRLWEALYLGCIPIVTRRAFTEYFAQYLPIILVKSFNEVNLHMLMRNLNRMEKQTYHYAMLKMSYWKGEISRIKARISNGIDI